MACFHFPRETLARQSCCFNCKLVAPSGDPGVELSDGVRGEHEPLPRYVVLDREAVKLERLGFPLAPLIAPHCLHVDAEVVGDVLLRQVR